MRWVDKMMVWLGVNGYSKKKPPELGRAISEAELRNEALGFIAIVDRPKGRINIVLCLKELVLDDIGGGLYKGQMNWETYGRKWQAYEIEPFEGWSEADAEGDAD